MLLCPETCLFMNRSSSSACIMALPKLTFVLFGVPFLFHCCEGDDLWYVCYGFGWRPGRSLQYSLLGMLPNMFKQFKAKWRVVIHHDQVTHPLLNRKWGKSFNDQTFCIFSIIAGLIVEILFMLFSIYNELKMSILANGEPYIHHWKSPQRNGIWSATV